MSIIITIIIKIIIILIIELVDSYVVTTVQLAQANVVLQLMLFS